MMSPASSPHDERRPASAMTAVDSALRLRKGTGFVGAFFCVMLFLALLDGCVAKFREPLNVFEALQGAALNIDGPLPKRIEDTGGLFYQSTSDRVTVSFDAIQTGYMFGGNMWIGRIHVDSQAPPGTYDVRVFLQGEPPDKPLSVYRVNVHSDYASLQRTYRSVVQRYVDISPWWVALACVPLIGAVMGTVYLISQRIERLLAREGKAEVYRVARSEAGYELAFGLGTRHGLSQGSPLTLLTDKGVRAGEVRVHTVFESDATALTDLELDRKAGYIVSMRP